jgi:SAM-dependent methyltransferase
VETDGTTSTDVENWDGRSGMDTVVYDETSTGSIHETGNEGTANWYTLDKTSSGHDDSTQTADTTDGDYTAGGDFGSTSTAIETNAHGGETARNHMLYDKAYYASIVRAAESSARVIVPLVQDLIGPRSVLDVGCGNGIWLDAYRRAGVADYYGVDGAGAGEVLRIPEDHFSVRDLTIPLDLGRQFDLVQSLEVAEHLPALSAGNFIRSLTRHGDAVLFSAAIPYQGGTGHLNEQWPDYWAVLFREHGFEAYDGLRPQVWGDGRVAWWYAQNTLLFVRSGARLEWVRRLPPAAPVGPGLRMVHPNRYLGSAKQSVVPRPVAECLEMQPWRSTPS